MLSNKKIEIDKIYIITYNNKKETNTMNNLINVKLNNWWEVWGNKHSYKFVMF